MANAQHPLITEWYQSERQQRRSQRDDAGLVMGFPLWGDAYFARFFDYMLPSILANQAALDAHRWELVLYVDEPVHVAIQGSRWLRDWPISYRVIPDPVMQVLYAEPGYKYALLTAVHNLLIQQAAAKGAGFSMATADVVYSERFFENLLRRGQTHDVIAHLALIASGAEAELAQRRQGGVLALSAPDLGSLGWRHAAGSVRSWLMNDVETLDALPASHILLWRGLAAIHIRCPHLTPIWLSAARCRAMPTDLGDTLDAVGHLYPEFYVPTVADDMTVLTLDDTRNHPAERVPLETFKDGFRPFASCTAQFRARCVIPTLPAIDGLPDDVIERQFLELMQLLELA